MRTLFFILILIPFTLTAQDNNLDLAPETTLEKNLDRNPIDRSLLAPPDPATKKDRLSPMALPPDDVDTRVNEKLNLDGSSIMPKNYDPSEPESN